MTDSAGLRATAGFRSFQKPSRYTLLVASRAVIAIAGGYALSCAVAAASAVALAAAGMPRADAAMAATMLAFSVHALAAMWAFGCATVWRAAAWVLIPAAILALATWLSGVGLAGVAGLAGVES